MRFFVFIFVSIVGFGSISTAQARNFRLDGYDLDSVQSVYLLVYDRKHERQDASRSQFRLAMFINGTTQDHLVEVYRTSPGMLIDNPEPGKEPELTPEGIFYPQRLEKDWVSNQFGGKVLGIFETGRMPNSIFFHRGFAIHGSYAGANGLPKSKGCLRLAVRHSDEVFAVVEAAIRNTGLTTSVTIDIRHTEQEYVRNYRQP
jgi:hypothetical protein